MTTDAPLPPPLFTGIITVDPTDPEWAEILSMLCTQCSSIAHILQRAGYDIKRHAEEEQGAVLMWLLSLYRDHGKEWRVKGQEKLKAISVGDFSSLCNDDPLQTKLELP